MISGELLERTTSPVYSACFSPSGELAAWGSRNGVVKITAMCSRSVILNETYGSSVVGVGFSADSASLLVTLKDQARLINVASSDSVATYHHPGIENAVLSPNQDLIYTAGSDGSLRMWGRGGGLRAEVTIPREHLLDICFGDSADTLVVSGTGGNVYFMNAATLSLKHTVSFPKSTIYKCRLDNTGGMLAVSLHLKTGLWMPERYIPVLIPDRYEIAFLRTGQRPAKLRLNRTLVGHTGWIGALAFSPTSSLLASGATDSRICLWDPETRSCRANIGGHDGFVHDIRFSPAGEALISASGDGTVRFWTVSSLFDAAEDNQAERLDLAMSEAARRTAPAARVNALAQTLVGYVLLGSSERIEECKAWFDHNLPSQRSRIELVSKVTHVLQVLTEQAFRESDEPRAGYLNWIRLALCSRLGPVSPNGEYGGRQFPERSESAKLANTWLRSRLSLPETKDRRPDVHATLARIYREQLESGDRESYRHAVSSLESAAELTDPKINLREFAILYRDLGDVHFQQDVWASAHAAYERAADLVAELINVTYTMKDLHLLIRDFIHVFSNDAYSLVRLKRYQHAVLRLDQGKTRFMNSRFSRECPRGSWS